MNITIKTNAGTITHNDVASTHTSSKGLLVIQRDGTKTRYAPDTFTVVND